MHINDFRDAVATATPVKEFTPDGLVEAFGEAFGRDGDLPPLERRVLLITSRDLCKILLSEDLQNLFDPALRVDVFERGNVGTFMGMQLATDACLKNPEDRFLRESAVYCIPG